ncbi:MAG: DNA polymerase IV [Bacteroidales bacterium]
MSRKIIHMDMDAFYASIEQLDTPELKGKPLAVGGRSGRGVVAAASYEARSYGVRSAMPMQQALKRCPHLIVVPTRMERYKEISKQIMSIFLEYTHLVEPLSIDEAFLDVTYNKKEMPSATLIASEIKKRIWYETGLKASAGVSYNKFLAKIASDEDKPDGLFVITPDKAIRFLEDLPIEKFFGIGAATAKKMHEEGIRKGKDLKNRELPWLQSRFGKSGVAYYHLVRGEDERPVNPNRIRKSVGAERTYTHNLTSDEEIDSRIQELINDLEGRLLRNQKKGKTLTLKVRYNDFETHTYSRTPGIVFEKSKEISETTYQLVKEAGIHRPVRLLGLTVSNLLQPPARNLPIQLTLDF